MIIPILQIRKYKEVKFGGKIRGEAWEELRGNQSHAEGRNERGRRV